MDDGPLHRELARARAHTDAVFGLIADEALYDRPIPDRHRLVLYLGHLDAFDWNQVARGALGAPSFQPDFDRLFEAGIDPPPGKAPQDTAADWPCASEVRAYAQRARQGLDRIWDAAPTERRLVAIEHRWMHAETLCYLLHQLPYSAKRRPALRTDPAAPAPGQDEIDIPAGRTTLGQRSDSFGWDNEFPAFELDVPAFSIARHKVTNAQYLRFVADGGPSPHFWRERDGQWWLRRMFDEVPLPAHAPAYVTHRQARAYAMWAGADLPTEAQWHRAAYGDDDRAFPWGNAEPSPRRGHFDFTHWDPASVAALRAGSSRYGVEQLLGNGWEWTSTTFAGFDGFAARDYYPGYSANFFDGEHWVLKGASPRTARCLLRRSFRNWFRGDYPYAYTAFRVVRN
jgi:formylglycine-generating enzyme required for sulfatase activity